MTEYINKEVYVGDTSKQLKDIKANADNIATILNRGYIAVNYSSSTCQTRTWQFEV